MTTETDNFAANNQNDGEEIVYQDINALSMLIGARVTDQLLAKLIPFLPNGVANGDPGFQGEYGTSIGAFSSKNQARAFALTAGGAYPWVGTATIASKTLATNAVGFAPGTIMQLIGDDNTGTDSQLLAYTFNGNESVSIAANASGNPRVDLIEVALSFVTTDSQMRDFEDATTGANTSVAMNKLRQVQCVYQVKQGVAAASPVIPTPDAGFCALAAVVVGAGYATTTQIIAGVDTAGANAVLHDLRIPLGVRACPVRPADFIYFGGAGYGSGYSGTGAGWLPAPTLGAPYSVYCETANAPLYIPCPAFARGKLLAVALEGQFQTGYTSTVQLGSLTLTGSGSSFTPTLSFVELASIGAALIAQDSTQHFKIATLDTLDAAMAPAAGPTVQPDATDTIGPPVWVGGARTPSRPFEASATSAADPMLALQVETTQNAGAGFPAASVFRAVFFVAEGL